MSQTPGQSLCMPPPSSCSCSHSLEILHCATLSLFFSFKLLLMILTQKSLKASIYLFKTPIPHPLNIIAVAFHASNRNCCHLPQSASALPLPTKNQLRYVTLSHFITIHTTITILYLFDFHLFTHCTVSFH